MKSIPNSFFKPSNILQGLDFNKGFILNFDCFLYESSDSESVEVFFKDYLDFNLKQKFFVFDISDIQSELVTCYQVVCSVEQSDCFLIKFLETFEKSKLQDESFLLEKFKINYNTLLKKFDSYVKS